MVSKRFKSTNSILVAILSPELTVELTNSEDISVSDINTFSFKINSNISGELDWVLALNLPSVEQYWLLVSFNLLLISAPSFSVSVLKSDAISN